ncbi:MAG: polyamine aminopropyltransferase [Candidatus Eremiobacteraeota bacterium]|nr:polyamine aminopropyltransferase [Candidatus Eremiobacteraeota bacterium]
MENNEPPGSSGVLLISVFLVATCGLVYELIAGALASYLLGDSVLQFSTIIGDYLFAMGVGSYLAQFVGRRQPAVAFARLQNSIAFIGGFSAAAMHVAYSYSGGFRLVLYLLVFVVGLLVGVEIPLLMTILKRNYSFRELVSQVLALDYLGALLASILFPMLLIPYLGLIRTSFCCGLVNVAVAWIFMSVFRLRVPLLRLETAVVGGLLLLGLAGSERITRWAEEGLYPDPIVLSRTTQYQRLVVTRKHQEVRLYLNGNLQFSSRDEYRYHEALVHTPLSCLEKPRRVLILGGGDGLAAREVLRYPEVEQVLLVDLDPAMTSLFRDHQFLNRLNQHSLSDKRLRILNADAFVWVSEPREAPFDAILVDFPDPSNYAVGKLYTKTFYQRLHPLLAPGGALSVQCTSPLFARRSYWCIVETIRAAGWQVSPYHLYVPSFGEWGFTLATREAPPHPEARRLPRDLRYLDAAALPDMFLFPADMAALPSPVNRLFDQVLVRYYEQDWRSIVDS